MKNKINVAFAINDNYAEYLGVSVYSLLKNNSHNSFNIVVLSGDISEQNKQILRGVIEKFKNSDIEFILPDETIFNKLPITIDHISKETYYRYVLADALPDIDKILYLDVDLLVLGDISGLWSKRLGQNYVAGAQDNFVTLGAEEFYDSNKFVGYKDSIGFGKDDPYINAGVLLFNLKKIRQDGLVSRLVSNTYELRNKIKFQDQDVINITFKNAVSVFSNIYNFTERDMLLAKHDKTTVKIVHYNGPSKPWHKYRHAPDFAKYFNDIYLGYYDEYRQLVRFLGAEGGEENIKYALFAYKTDNIGDEIQSIAARRFLPRVDYYVDRDDIDNLIVDKLDRVKIIMNGWYSHEPDLFPPDNQNIDPLLISMYISEHVKERFSTDRSRHFLNKYGPVGARNTDTKHYFDEIGVESYFSGCLTLTIQGSPDIKKQDFILAVDVPDDALSILKKKSKLPVLEMGAYITTEALGIDERFSLAELYLYLYQSARCVVTTRLHATLPCLALGTSVLNIEKENFESGRFAGLRELSHHVTVDEYIRNPEIFDVNNPPENPKEYLKIRTKLIDKCKDYTGYINNDGFLSLKNDNMWLNIATLQPLMNGLRSNYKLNYIDKILADRVDMVNQDVAEVRSIRALKEELNVVSRQHNELLNSKTWRLASTLRRSKSLFIRKRNS